jgi:hypothetical protein
VMSFLRTRVLKQSKPPGAATARKREAQAGRSGVLQQPT